MAFNAWVVSLFLLGLTMRISAVPKCPGGVSVSGNSWQVVATQKNMEHLSAGPVEVVGGSVKPLMWGRAYLADRCGAGAYNHTHYAAMKFLGKKFSYTTELSQAGCGCNAALYLVSMKQNPVLSTCDDYYCDANSVCGVRCDEIDIQEANRFAWHSALHRFDDGNGIAQGLGGWVRDNHFEMTTAEYGPGGRCIDTHSPFRVEVSFPAEGERLLSMDVKLSQAGKGCHVEYSMDRYSNDPRFEHLSQSLHEGMTPVFSYWKAGDMLWLDGPGRGGGPCRRDTMECGISPQFYDFTLEPIDANIVYP